MAKYQGVLSSTWGDPVFQAWPNTAKLLFLNLITSERQNAAGIYGVTRATLQFETGLTTEEFEEGWTVLIRIPQGEDYARVAYDRKHQVVWIVNTIKHQPGLTEENVNAIRNVHAVLRQHIESELVEECLRFYRKRGLRFLFEGFNGYVKGLSRGLGAPSKPPNIDKDRDRDTERGGVQGRGIALTKYLASSAPYDRIKRPDDFAGSLLAMGFEPEWLLAELKSLAGWFAATPGLADRARNLQALIVSRLKAAKQGGRDATRLAALTRGIGKHA